MALPLQRTETEVSTPTNRIRWGTRREDEEAGARRRTSILSRLSRRHAAQQNGGRNGASKRSSVEQAPAAEPVQEQEQETPRPSDDSAQTTEADDKRTVYFNLPLPDHARDEDGRPLKHYARNKIRTSKYTPISFIPKNLFYQFHNVANLYFLFIIILGVSCCNSLTKSKTNNDRLSQFSELPIRGLMPPLSYSSSQLRRLKMPSKIGEERILTRN